MTTENIKIQDYSPQKVLGTLQESEKASKRSATAQAVAPAVATFFAVEGSRTASPPSSTQLEQRLETLEAIAFRLEQRLSALEQGQLSTLSSVKASPTETDFQSVENPHEAALSAVAPTHKYAETNEAQAGAAADERSTTPLLPLGALSPEAWCKGLVTNQLVARLQTNPTTLKKYLRDLKQTQWAVQRDPDGLGWVYDSPLQCYYPLRVESDGDVSTQGLPTPPVDAESRPELSQRHEVALQDKLGSIEYGYLMGQGGLYQTDLASLIGVPINTLQRWKHLPDCAERIRCRTEGQYCYWYAKQTKRFYPLNASTAHSFGTVSIDMKLQSKCQSWSSLSAF
jgi:hypothetical protein